MKTFIEAEQLKQLLNTPETLVADCRFDLFDPAYGRRSYDAGHLPGAVFLDVNRDLCGPPGLGGARPAVPPELFAERLKALGVGTESLVVVYDDDLYGAARAFWQMKYTGIRKVCILRGGFRAWLEAKGPVTKEVPGPRTEKELVFSPEFSIFCDREHVLSRLGRKGTALIDGRRLERFTGEYEPLYAKAGHIPGALSYPCSEVLEGPATLRDPEALKAWCAALSACDEIISYCGSGIAGARNFVALRELGLPVRLYPGSLSDWISDPENPVETGTGACPRV